MLREDTLHEKPASLLSNSVRSAHYESHLAEPVAINPRGIKATRST